MARLCIRGEQLESRMLFAWDSISLRGLVFEPPVASAVVLDAEQIQAAVFSDLDGDGHQDLVFSRSQLSTISVALSAGSGVFGQPNHVDLPSSVDRIVAADVNHDGANDLVVGGPSRVISLITQRSPDGKWQGFVQQQSLASSTTSLEIGDVNGDGHLDLILGRSGRVDVRLGTGTGTFGAAIRYTSQAGDRVTALGDLDRDGDLDLVVGIGVSEGAGSQIVVLQNNGEGIFETQADAFPIGYPAATLGVADLDADGRLDLVIGHAAQENGNLSVWLGQGDGTLSRAPRQFEILGAPRQLEFAHVDQDGLLDIVVAHHGTFHHPINGNGPGGITLLIGQGTGSFHDATRITTPEPVALTAADVDSDGDTDILGVDYRTVSLFRSRPRHAFRLQAEQYQAIEFGYGQTVVGDLNQDGYPDIVNVVKPFSPEPQPSQLSVLLGTADGRFQSGPELKITTDVSKLLVGNFDADVGTELFLLVTSDFQTHQVWLTEIGLDGQFRRMTVTDLESSWSVDGVLDANADGRLDAIGFDASASSLRVLVSNGDGSFREGPIVSGSAAWRFPKIADFNRDGLPDVLTSDGDRVLVALGQGDGAFRTSFTQSFPYADCQVGDFDGDGRFDLAYMNYDSVGVNLAYGDGTGKFPRRETVPVGRNGLTLLVQDVDGNGRSDLIAADYEGLSLAWSTGAGFTPFAGYRLAHSVGDLVAADIDRDGLQDLVVAPGFGFFATQAQVTVFAGGAPGSFSNIATYSFPSFLSSGLFTADFGGDGDLDLVLGTSTGFLALDNDRGPAIAGDLDRDGRVSATDVDLLCQRVQQGDTDPWFDLNTDGRVDTADVDFLIESLLHTVAGDVNLDGIFNSEDFVLLFQIGEYEDGEPLNSAWSEGDLDCDGDFTSADIVLAFQKGGYSTT